MQFARTFRRRRLVVQVFAIAFLLSHILETARVLRYLTNHTEDAVTWRSQRIYIASLHWNNEEILRSHWNDAVVALADRLGRDNVFITVYESGSWDDSKGALRELELALEAHGIRRNITLSPTTHLDEIALANRSQGWVDTPQGSQGLRRIPYLSRLRNLSLEPLQELFQQGERFDKVLFLNDVVFNVRNERPSAAASEKLTRLQTEDVFRLLDTNKGDYAAACSLDFSRPPELYDSFALRDAEGHEMIMQTWPYFRARQSRDALLANRPVPVTSCWNGMVAMPAEPFLTTSPLRFRGIPDSLASFHLEGSECCLIHVDNPLRLEKRTFVNPQVLVGYSGNAYSAAHPQPGLLSARHISKALWENRFRRWITSPALKDWVIRRRIGQWKARSEERKENGAMCLINEMQILADNGWAHV